MRRAPATWTLLLVVAAGSLTAAPARGERTPASLPAPASQLAPRLVLHRQTEVEAAPRRLDLRLRAPDVEEEPRLHVVRPFVAMLLYQLLLSAEGWAIHSHWPIGWYRPKWSWWKENLTTPPEWNDGDPWWLNYGGHAIFGSDHYLMARNAGWSWYASVLFNTFGSFFWEYGTEGLWEHPSAIDLLLTPIVGSLLGEARYRAYRIVKRRWGTRWYGYVIMCILDPTTMFFEKALRWR